jgi:hypothetical protein
MIECLLWKMVSPDGGEVTELPPNGQATPTALKRAPLIIATVVENFWKDLGITVDSLTCGQGLVDHYKMVGGVLKKHHKWQEAVLAEQREATLNIQVTEEPDKCGPSHFNCGNIVECIPAMSTHAGLKAAGFPFND